MRAMPTLTLTYFDSPGRAEPIRVALHIAGVPFEDRRLKFPAFNEAKTKGSFPLGSVPVLDVDGFSIPQTGAILRYVARLADTGLYPTDLHAALLVDSVLDCFNDTLSHGLFPSLRERDPEKKVEMRRAFASGPMAMVYRFAEQCLERSGGPFVAGATLSIADLVVATQTLGVQSGALDGLGPDDVAPFPRVRQLTEAYLADPRVAAYMTK
jgi:glutathione S-transferase